MALDDLLAALEREARAEREALLAAAKDEAARLASEARDTTARTRVEALARIEREQRAGAAVRAAEVRRAARRGVLEARQRFLDRVFDAARGLLPEAAASAAYRTVVPVHLERAVACLGDAPAEVRCPPALAEAVRALLLGRPQLTVRASDDAAPGIYMVRGDGGLEVDATLTGELARRRPDLAIGVLAATDGA